MSRPVTRSENVQMYLVHIFRLREGEDPVPLSSLADALSISAISVNQMCRKLQKEGLVTYKPYKGAALTRAGEQLATRVLRRHGLWEVFLVERLHMRWERAHETACLLEHATPDEVMDRLDDYLNHPHVNPQGELIPTGEGTVPQRMGMPLAEMEAGQSGCCVRCAADEATRAFLTGQGMRSGASFEVVAAAPQSLLIDVSGRRFAVDRALAQKLWVEPDEPAKDSGEQVA